MRYLITGGAGFIGSHLADALLSRGDVVSVVDDFSTGSTANISHLLGHPSFFVHEGSVLNESLVHELTRESDAVVHLAASVGVQLILDRPLESLLNNIRGTETVLEACAAFRRKVLIASSSEVYGKNGQGPLAEDADRLLGSTFKARWSYSEAKAVDESLAYSFWRERGTPTIVVRFFNIVGPRQVGTYGMVIPRFVHRALRDEDLIVYGDGEQRRCFCHVRDAVKALMALLDHPGSVGNVFNLGSQEEVTINDLARFVVERTSSRSRIIHIPYEVAFDREFEDMHRRVPDIAKVKTLAGWLPAATLDEIIDDVMGHERTMIGAP
jgi:UDP-glucose 4-epimerase